jgi:hypothetical protein
MDDVHLEPSCTGTGEHEFSWGSISKSTLHPSFLLELGATMLKLAAKHCENEKKVVLPNWENTKINCKGEVCNIELAATSRACCALQSLLPPPDLTAAFRPCLPPHPEPSTASRACCHIQSLLIPPKRAYMDSSP